MSEEVVFLKSIVEISAWRKYRMDTYVSDRALIYKNKLDMINNIVKERLDDLESENG